MRLILCVGYFFKRLSCELLFDLYIIIQSCYVRYFSVKSALRALISESALECVNVRRYLPHAKFYIAELEKSTLYC